MVEMQVALAVLGITLAGLFPLVAGQLKVIKAVEKQFSADLTYTMIPRDHHDASQVANSGGPGQAGGASSPPPKVQLQGLSVDETTGDLVAHLKVN